MARQVVTEEMHPEKEWFQKAKEQTPDTIMAYINHVMNDYSHDYGTICHAIAACAVAAAWAANNADGACGGITGFQSSFVMWDFIRHWMYENNKCGMRLVDYDCMLYPQYRDKFDKTISKDVWEQLQKAASENLKTYNAASSVMEHWKSIVNGKVPFGYSITD